MGRGPDRRGGDLRYLFLIVLPISRAALVTTILFTFIGTWNALDGRSW